MMQFLFGQKALEEKAKKKFQRVKDTLFKKHPPLMK